jgi:hypothetical protein
MKHNIFKHFSSKKFAVSIWGTANVMFVFLISLLVMIIKPELAPAISGLANICIVFLGSVTGVLIGGQSLCDWSNNSTNQFDSNSSSSIETKNENVKEEIVTRIERPKSHDDGSVD